VVEQQFGEFPTWTQAHNCACKLNEGLDLLSIEIFPASASAPLSS
jgi:hypothetical protein